MTTIHKNKRLKSKKITDSAKGEDCTLRLSPNCTDEYGKVVLCHIGHVSGISAKCHDTFAVYGCNHCHDIIDSRVKTDIAKGQIAREKLRALEETQSILIRKGLIKT